MFPLRRVGGGVMAKSMKAKLMVGTELKSVEIVVEDGRLHILGLGDDFEGGVYEFEDGDLYVSFDEEEL